MVRVCGGEKCFHRVVVAAGCKGIVYLTPVEEDSVALLLALHFYGREDFEMVQWDRRGMKNMRELISSNFFSRRRLMQERAKKEKAIGVLCGTVSRAGVAQQVQDTVAAVRRYDSLSLRGLMLGAVRARRPTLWLWGRSTRRSC